MYFIEKSSNFHTEWTRSRSWSGENGYKTIEEADTWKRRAELNNAFCVQATSFKFRIVKDPATLTRGANEQSKD